ncbi:MAG TPA: tail fiber domain-containing protein [Elusimicrobiota bacterium]|nr:tail fiber domain-containing protein [Elusimicrobiota bacterium]
MKTRIARLAALPLLLLQAGPRPLAAETVTMTTTYPAPSGVYQTVVTTGGNAGAPANTVLARDAGDVGIGVSKPVSKVHVFSPGTTELSVDSPTPAGPTPNGAILSLRQNGKRKWSFWNLQQGTNQDALIYSDQNNNWNYIFNPEEKYGGTGMNILSNSSAYINLWGAGNTGNPWYGALLFRKSFMAAQASWSLTFNNLPGASRDTLGFAYWKPDGTAIGTLTLSPQGNVGVGTNPKYRLDVAGIARANQFVTASDARLKKNIQPLSGALERLLRLRGVTYEWKEPAQHGGAVGPQVGVIAQEVEKVFPDWVTTNADGYKDVGFKGFEGVAVESFRELKAENEALKRRLDALEKALLTKS